MKLAPNSYCPCKSGLRYKQCCKKWDNRQKWLFLWITRLIIATVCIWVGVYIYSQINELISSGQLCAPIRGMNVKDCNGFAYFKLLVMFGSEFILFRLLLIIK